MIYELSFAERTSASFSFDRAEVFSPAPVEPSLFLKSCFSSCLAFKTTIWRAAISAESSMTAMEQTGETQLRTTNYSLEFLFILYNRWGSKGPCFQIFSLIYRYVFCKLYFVNAQQRLAKVSFILSHTLFERWLCLFQRLRHQNPKPL